MPRLPLHPSSGTGRMQPFVKVIRFVRYGCSNRPFFHIVVMNSKLNQHHAPIEQLGTYDPMPNKYNEKLIALNFERIQYWLGSHANVSKPVAELFGLAGFYPVHPRTYITAWRNRGDYNKAEEDKDFNSATPAESAG
ncbi:PREDICTED: probable 28S ribosomal protein S16, mitochondrial [Dufourea novaeangliae]|uniref:Small ribosomal subunit protein bS16m n=1 Tax=Dufourea novaeangliae TaxID=178035 RepID=A0A154P154_DUFNO|nr:PREDICTED: probable 28S ribosomal protein S16, mitochondrial [Dufourea novaeangliae]KZC05669.1 putative 28S ribosomal protein S16, mitochondrial [Dufourea novaeangliae]